MTQPPPYAPADPYGSPGTGGWPAPTWAPAWEPAPGTVPFGAPVFHPPAPRPQNRGTVVALVALVAAGGALVGAVVAGLLVAVLFAAAAENIGRGMGEEFVQSMEGAMGIPPEGMWSSEYATSGPVEEHPPVAPGPLGPDPVLDAYADSCFAGEMQACDDLFFESPPMSAYEEYGVTCGGRVKQFDVMACTDLDCPGTRRPPPPNTAEMVEVGAPGP